MNFRSATGGLLMLAALSAAGAITLTVAACGGDSSSLTNDSDTLSVSPVHMEAPPDSVEAPEPAKPAREDETMRDLGLLLSTYSVESQFRHIAELASDKYAGRKTGSAGARSAAAYISSQFSSLGMKPWSELGLNSFTHHFSAGEYESDNIISVLPGTGQSSSYVILAAHYDHLGVSAGGEVFNGADDNAAGVAAVLETARMLRESGMRPGKTIVFCSFSGEEQGQLGAQALAALISANGLDGGVEMINIDGIGATGGSYFGVWDEGAVAAAPLVNALKQAGNYLEVPVREEGTDIGSDAQAFAWQFGIPAVTVDWNWGQDESAFHPYYHTVYDDAGNIDQASLSQATRVAIAGLWLRAQS